MDLQKLGLIQWITLSFFFFSFFSCWLTATFTHLQAGNSISWHKHVRSPHFPHFFCIQCIFVRFFVYFVCQGECKNRYRNSKSWSRMVMPKDNNNKFKIFEIGRTFMGVLWGKLMTYCLWMCGKSCRLCLSGSGLKHLEQNFKNSPFGIRKPDFAFWRALFFWSWIWAHPG